MRSSPLLNLYNRAVKKLLNKAAIGFAGEDPPGEAGVRSK